MTPLGGRRATDKLNQNRSLRRCSRCCLVPALRCFALALRQDLLLAVKQSAPHPKRGGAFFFAVDLLMGIWAMWLYSTITPRYGEGPRTAVIAGVAWWSIKSLQSAKWAGLGFVPQGVVLVSAGDIVCRRCLCFGAGGLDVPQRADAGRRLQCLTNP